MWSLYSYLKFGSIPVAYPAIDNCVWIMNFSPPMLGNDEDHMEITPWNMKMLGAMVMKTY